MTIRGSFKTLICEEIKVARCNKEDKRAMSTNMALLFLVVGLEVTIPRLLDGYYANV
jgi:hypothetical protein